MTAEEENTGTWWLTVAAWLSLTVFAATTTLVSVSLKRLGTELDIGFGERGTVALVRAVTLALSALATGYVADRVGKKWLLTVAMLVIAAGLASTLSVATFGHLLLVIVVIGIGLGCLEALVSPLVAQLHRGDVEAQMNLLHAFYPVGIVASSLAFGGALDRGVGWRTLFALMGVPAAGVGLMFAAGRYGPSERSHGVAPLKIRAIARRPVFWLLCAGMLFGAGCEGALTYWTPNIIQEEYAASAATGGLGLTLFSGAMAVGRFGLGAATRRWPTRHLFTAMVALGVVSVVGLALVHSVWGSFVFLTLAGFSVAIVWPGLLSLAANRISAGSATLFAMLSAAGIVGFGVAPQFLGLLAEGLGLRGGLMVVPLFFLGMGIAVAAVFHISERPPAPEDAS